MSDSAALSQRSDLVVYLNGAFVPANEARVGVATHALSYGTGIFEGIRAYWNKEREDLYIFRVREHYERMHRSARIMRIELPYSVDQLVAATQELLSRNAFRENTYIRPFAYKSDEIIGVKLDGLVDHFTIYAMPMGDYISTQGLRCAVSSWRRVDDNMIPARAKISGAYVNSALAKSEALMSGFDEAIMLTSEGHVSEGSAENIFVFVGDELVTPPPSENILLGITRDTVMRLAREQLGLTVRERVIDRTELYTADEIILTGTGAQIAPVCEVDHRPVGTGTVGPVAAKLQQLYHDVVRGMLPEYAEWCAPVYGTRKAEHAVSKKKAAMVAGTVPLALADHNGNGHNGNGHNGHNGHNGNGKVSRAKGTAAASKK